MFIRPVFAANGCWTYATMALAEASGDAWQAGDCVIVNGITFLYHTGLDIGEQSGLLHQDPFSLGDDFTSYTEHVRGARNTDMTTWTNWTQTWDEGSSNRTLPDGGYSRMFSFGAGQRFELTRAPVVDEVTVVIEDLAHIDAITGGTSEMDYLICAYNAASGSVSRVSLAAQTAETDWRVNGILTSTPYGTPTRLWIYCSETHYAVYTDDELLGSGTPTTYGGSYWQGQVQLHVSTVPTNHDHHMGDFIILTI